MKKPSLSAALKEVARPEPTQVKPAVGTAQRNGIVAPSREGKRAITGFFDPAVSKQLKHIGLERDATVQDLLREALNDLFEKHGRSPIA